MARLYSENVVCGPRAKKVAHPWCRPYIVLQLIYDDNDNDDDNNEDNNNDNDKDDYNDNDDDKKDDNDDNDNN